VPDSPQFQIPVYMVFARESDSAVLEQALAGLRTLAASERAVKMPGSEAAQ